MFHCSHRLLAKHVTPLGFLCDNLPFTINIPLLSELKCPPLKLWWKEGENAKLNAYAGINCIPYPEYKFDTHLRLRPIKETPLLADASGYKFYTLKSSF